MGNEKTLVIDPFKGNADKIEMSRYIDLDLYHSVERTHPFYIEMVREIKKQLRSFAKKSERVNVLEFGAGTGILTAELMELENVHVDAVELDRECCKILSQHVRNNRCVPLCDNAVTYCRPGRYDAVISSFAHDHIHFKQSKRLAHNIRRNLRPGGIYIMGGEILPQYTTEFERTKALYRYHCFIIEKALRDRNFEVAQIEINALRSGIEKTGDFKRHEEMFEAEMASSGLRLLRKKKIGPVNDGSVGGVFVYVYQN